MKSGEEILKILHQELVLARHKNPQYSTRAFAKKLNLYPSALSDLLNGRRRITKPVAKKILFRLGVEPEKSIKLIDNLAPPSRRKSKQNEEKLYHQLNMDNFHILSDWFYFAVFSLVETYGFRDDPNWIAKRLSISVVKARLALKRLEHVGLLTRDAYGQLKTTDKQITTTTDIASVSLRKSHFQNLELAQNSLEIHQVMDRDFSSMTMATSAKKLDEAKQKIKSFRRKLCEFLEDTKPEEKTDVFQINIQLFPLTAKTNGVDNDK